MISDAQHCTYLIVVVIQFVSTIYKVVGVLSSNSHWQYTPQSKKRNYPPAGLSSATNPYGVRFRSTAGRVKILAVRANIILGVQRNNVFKIERSMIKGSPTEDIAR